MDNYHDIAIIIPAYRPNENLLQLIQHIRSEFNDTIIVVDDGNQSKTIFEKIKDCVILHHPKNLGKGAALKTAFQYVLDHLPEVEGVVTADADGQHSVIDIMKLVQLLHQDTRGFYLATRHFDQSTPFRNKLGNLLTRQIFTLVTGVKIMDTQNGLRGIPRWLFPMITIIPQQRYDYEMAMLKVIAMNQIPIVQVPTQTIYHHQGAVSSFNPWRDSLLIYRILLKSFFRFLLVGMLSFGLDYLLFLAFYQGLSGSWRVMFAVTFARLISGTFNYLMNRFYSFQANVRFIKSGMQYLLLFLSIMTASAVLTDGLTLLGFSHYLAKIMVDLLLFFVSYRIQKKYIFPLS